uniref:uncharacterized protein LOC122597557 n=1 Tax=Erigeron canadensis TaxID=72917 RepID=UPI001CB92569|nr:uncharacterized protein LOC122597557 [Erigeron canadensis]
MATIVPKGTPHCVRYDNNGTQSLRAGIQEVKKKEGVSFIAFQEIQCSSVDDNMIKKLWGISSMEWELVEPTGRSGGMISVWDPGVFMKVDVVKDSNFLAIKGKIKGHVEFYWLVNVYAPQKLKDKKSLWDKLAILRCSNGGMWLFMGDFNVVRIPEDRNGSIFNTNCTRAFNNFIYESDLHEYEMKGNRYTFLKESNGRRKFSKIDRFLVGNEVLNCWPNACLRALPRLLSDHNPIMLTIKEINYGPKPFQLKVWRDKNRDNEAEEKERCIEELAELDELMEVKELEEEESWTRTECLRRIDEINESNAKDLK